MQSQFETLRKLIEASSTIWCVTHINPDGDALGSVLAIKTLIAEQYPQKTVTAVCKDPAPAMFSYLPQVQTLQTSWQPKPGELVIFTDCAVPKQSGWDADMPELFTKDYLTANVDHHGSNSSYADCNIVHSEVASACEIVFAFAKDSNWKVTPDIATQLLTGLMTDTGGFLHGNTNKAAYKTGAELCTLGANRDLIVKQVFRTAKLSTLRLWGKVLEKITITPQGAAVSGVTRRDFEATGAEYSELTGAIDYVNSVPGMRFSLVLAEKEKNLIKGSLRTLRTDVDVSKMAGKFDGGGHKAAAGFSIDGSLKQNTSWQVQKEHEA